METAYNGLIGFSLDRWGDIADDRHHWTLPVYGEEEGMSDDAVVLVVWRKNEKGGYHIFGVYSLEQLVVALVTDNLYSANLNADLLSRGLDMWLAGL